jgi:hypothetical protein
MQIYRKARGIFNSIPGYGETGVGIQHKLKEADNEKGGVCACSGVRHECWRAPMLEKGVKEVGASGNLDFEGPQGGFDLETEATFGYFFARNLEIGPIVRYSRTNDGDIVSYGLGGFADYHFAWSGMARSVKIVPYVGASMELSFLDTDLGEDQGAVAFTPKAGIKWFLRSYLAIDTHFYMSLATDDIYVNDNELDNYDYGINLGLRVYFN